jgi:hypothetical protein
MEYTRTVILKRLKREGSNFYQIKQTTNDPTMWPWDDQ